MVAQMTIQRKTVDHEGRGVSKVFLDRATERWFYETRSSLRDLHSFPHFPSAEALGYCRSPLRGWSLWLCDPPFRPETEFGNSLEPRLSKVLECAAEVEQGQ